MKIVIGNDHAGVDLKNKVKEELRKKGHEVINVGTDTLDSVDYPDIAALASKYEGLSGSDISTAVLMAAFKAVRNGANSVDQSYIEDATANILASKEDNAARTGVTTKRVVSEEYAKSQMQRES